MNAMLGHMARDMTDIGEKWCILRTSGGRTLPLARSLGEAGFGVWTPVETTRQRVRKGPTTVEVERTLPIAPTFVFGKADQLADFAAILFRPFHRHPSFSIFQWGGRVPLVGSASLTGLRLREAEAAAAIEAAREEIRREELQKERVALLRTEQQRRKALRTQRRDFERGARVAVSDMPAFAGMHGTVIESLGTSAIVAFEGAHVWKIEAWQLMPVRVDPGLSTTA